MKKYFLAAILLTGGIANAAIAKPFSAGSFSVVEADRSRLSIGSKSDYRLILHATQRARLGDKFGAIADYSKLLKNDPGNGYYYACRAHLRAELADEDGAKEDCDSALNCRHNNAGVYFELGRTKSVLSDEKGAIE